MNYLWGGMIVIGVVYGALTGNFAAVTDQALTSAKEAISLCIAMAGVMAFWTGMMQIAENTGFIEKGTKLLQPVLSFLFPKIPKGHLARKYIATNMMANLLGLGWAATPAGLEAMKALAALEEERGNMEYQANEGRTASDEMCVFLIINISSLQLIPVNIIAYRSQYGSVNPVYIVGPAILATCVSTLAAVIFCKIRMAVAPRKRIFPGRKP